MKNKLYYVLKNIFEKTFSYIPCNFIFCFFFNINLDDFFKTILLNQKIIGKIMVNLLFQILNNLAIQ
jgi:hypothetical protein